MASSVKSITRWMKGMMMKRLHGMITCKEFEEFIMGYLDDELTRREKRVFEWHLKLCRECREYLSAYRRSIDISRASVRNAEGGVPEDVPEDLVKAVLDARKQG